MLKEKFYAEKVYKSIDKYLVDRYDSIHNSFETVGKFEEDIKQFCSDIRSLLGVKNVVSIHKGSSVDGYPMIIVNVYPITAGLDDVYYRAYDVNGMAYCVRK